MVWHRWWLVGVRVRQNRDERHLRALAGWRWLGMEVIATLRWWLAMFELHRLLPPRASLDGAQDVAEGGYALSTSYVLVLIVALRCSPDAPHGPRAHAHADERGPG